MECNHPLDPAMLERVKKPFCIRFDWPGRQPFAYTMNREDVAHCLMHVEQMQHLPVEEIQDQIREMITNTPLDHGMIVQALFYLCTHDPVWKAVEGVPTVDFAWVRPITEPWIIQFGRQEPGPNTVRMISSVSIED